MLVSILLFFGQFALKVILNLHRHILSLKVMENGQKVVEIENILKKSWNFSTTRSSDNL